MKVQCAKNLSTATNFTNGKVYECFYEKGKEYITGGYWIYDDLGISRFIIPNDYSPHLPHSYPLACEIVVHRCSGKFELIDNEPARECPVDPFNDGHQSLTGVTRDPDPLGAIPEKFIDVFCSLLNTYRKDPNA